MIKFIIGWCILNNIFGGVWLIVKIIERKREKKEENKHDYRDY